jgi:hypothetical protein
VRTLAEHDLDWESLGPVVAGYRARIEREVEADTRKLTALAAFRQATSDAPGTGAAPVRGRRGLSLRDFAEQRRRYLLDHPAIKAPGR